MEKFMENQYTEKTDTNIHDNIKNSHVLELLAERPSINIEAVKTGKVRLTKKIVSETVNIPVTLSRELLVIEHSKTNLDNVTEKITVNTDKQQALITLNGENIVLDDNPLEIVISEQTATVNIQTLVAEKVSLVINEHTTTEHIPITVRHEELVVEEIDLETVDK